MIPIRKTGFNIMKTGAFISPVLALALTGGTVYSSTLDFSQEGLPALAPPANRAARNAPARSQNTCHLPYPIRQAITTGDYARVQELITTEMKRRTITPNNAAVLEMSMLLELIRTTDAAIMTEFASRSEFHKAFLALFVQDPQWLELYLGCGLVPYKTDVGLDVLFRIWQDRRARVENKALAVALASAWGGGETDPSPRAKTQDPNRFNPVWRYNFFVTNAARGVLHPNFPNLRPWELRFVTGNPWQDWDDRSFEWALANINVPWDKYGSACWAATYTGTSKFGDSVQGGMYNLPFSALSQAETCQMNGGVCGAMSHLGCVAAQAHGIPAYTVGQPGHCAYAVRTERGQWVGGFGGPDGGMHNRIFGNQAPTSYMLMEAVFADDATIDKAYRYSFCARALDATGNKAAAIEMWQKALEAAPLHPFFRSALHKLMQEQGLTPTAAFEYLKKTLPLYTGHGFAAINMAADLEEQVKGMTDAQKIELYALMHRMIATTPSSWAIKTEQFITRQAENLSTNEARERFLGEALAIHMNAADPTTFGQLLEWAIKTYVEGGQAEVFSRAFTHAASIAAGSAPSAEDNSPDRLKKLTAAYNKAIIAAEQARSAPAFRAITEAMAAVCGKCPVNIALRSTVPGNPLPAAMFRISSTSNWDNPGWHLNITTPTGGKCHTGKEATPNMIVELTERRFISGCIIRKIDGNEGRMRRATVYTSEDGATWVPRESTDNMPKEWAITFPEGTPARWVKVEFDNSAGNDYAHISHFVIYGK